MTEARPAFYALAPGGWRDYLTVLHPPYTAWHLSYVAIGATLAPHFYADRLGAAAAAFFLALGIGAHALDEWEGRPLQTRIPERTLLALTVVSLAGAAARRSTERSGIRRRLRQAAEPGRVHGALGPTRMTEARPAFFALAPGGWRDYVTLLHLPYTAWHLSFVVLGAALAPKLHEGRLAAALVAFFLAMGIAAHALDELKGHPLATRIPDRMLVGLTVVSLAAAVAIGIAGAVAFDLWLLIFVAVGATLVPAYNLELFGGAIHNNLGFALAWGGFPLLTGYFACAGTISWVALLAAGYATLASYAQRTLSTPVRHARRRVAAVTGTLELRDGTREPLTHELLYGAQERALELLAAANVCLAVAVLLLKLT